MAGYKRILLKLSGELLGKRDVSGNIDFAKIVEVAAVLKALQKRRVEIGIVMGAGNIFRARMVGDGQVDRVAADHMGMMATIINSLALQSGLETAELDVRVLSAIAIPEIMENYVHKRAINHLKNGRVVIFAGGTGRPYFTTDTTAVIRALEVEADVVLKASDVEGVFDDDPHKNPDAKRYDTLSYAEALEKKLEVMDATSFALAQENKLPIIVFKYTAENLLDLASGKKVGTMIS